MRLSTSLALAALGLVASALPAAAGTLLVPSQFPTIQKALDAAKPYDTVLVSAKPKGAVYSEAVIISTPHVTLQGRGNPVLDPSALPLPPIAPGHYSPVYPNGIDVRAAFVAVRGLTIQNVGGPSFESGGSGVNVGSHVVDPKTYAPTFTSYGNVEVSGCTFTNDYYGIAIESYNGSLPYYGGTGAALKNYTVVGNTITGSWRDGLFLDCDTGLVAGNTLSGSTTGAEVYGTNVAVTGNRFTGSYYDGLDTNGDGITVTANEASTNGGFGIAAVASTYNPAVSDPNNPPASTVTSNSIHDNGANGGGGISLGGTLTASGNQLNHNAGYGLYLSDADYSTISFNRVIGTTFSGYVTSDGTGLYVYENYQGPLTITANQFTANAADGLSLYYTSAVTVSSNSATGNAGVGIHLDYYTDTATVTLNRALGNKLFDARDDTTALTNITYADGETAPGYGGAYGPSTNVWTKNQFGTTDPVGLGK